MKNKRNILDLAQEKSFSESESGYDSNEDKTISIDILSSFKDEEDEKDKKQTGSELFKLKYLLFPFYFSIWLLDITIGSALRYFIRNEKDIILIELLEEITSNQEVINHQIKELKTQNTENTYKIERIVGGRLWEEVNEIDSDIRRLQKIIEHVSNKFEGVYNISEEVKNNFNDEEKRFYYSLNLSQNELYTGKLNKKYSPEEISDLYYAAIKNAAQKSYLIPTMDFSDKRSGALGYNNRNIRYTVVLSDRFNRMLLALYDLACKSNDKLKLKDFMREIMINDHLK